MIKTSLTPIFTYINAVTQKEGLNELSLHRDGSNNLHVPKSMYESEIRKNK